MSVGASEIFELATDLGKASAKVASTLYTVYAEQGEQFAREWSENARATSGVHGKWYPDSITSETRVAFGIEVEVGPDSGRKQGSMGRGFEFGSVNQPPHLDGLRALGPADARLTRLSEAALGHVLP
jgi:hypothetical protein